MTLRRQIDWDPGGILIKIDEEAVGGSFMQRDRKLALPPEGLQSCPAAHPNGGVGECQSSVYVSYRGVRDTSSFPMNWLATWTQSWCRQQFVALSVREK